MSLIQSVNFQSEITGFDVSMSQNAAVETE